MKISFISGLILLLQLIYAQQTYTFEGVILDKEENQPLYGANIYLESLRTGTSSKQDGSFRFSGLTEGKYKFVVSFIGHKSKILDITIPTEKVTVYMDHGTVDLENVVVTGNPFNSASKNLTQSVLSLKGNELKTRKSLNLAQSMDFQPGISVIQNGAAAARPIIRGFSNNRILILQDGLRIGDLSNTAPDHAISSDLMSNENIEILRGPASLLYGNNALGGVVNLISSSIPEVLSDKFISEVNFNLASVNDLRGVKFNTLYTINEVSFSANLYTKKSDDLRLPGDIRLDNTALKNSGLSFGISYLPKDWLIGFNYNYYKSDYGLPVIPEGEEHEDEEGEEDHHHSHSNILLDMKKTEIRGKIEKMSSGSFFDKFSLKAGYSDYSHNEISKATNVVGSGFRLEAFSADLSATHQISRKLSGVSGLWILSQKYKVKGDEALTPNSDYSAVAAYLYEKFETSNFNLTFGLRFENNSLNIPETVLNEKLITADKKDYNTLSYSLGTVIALTGSVSVFANYGTALRAPTIEELASYSVHEATASFDIGDLNLNTEKNNGFDLGLRVKKPHHSVEFNIYYNRIKNYIFKYRTDEVFNDGDEALPVFRYTQNDAKIYGFETKASYDFTQKFSITAVADLVRGELVNSGNLPLMPPFRFMIEPKYYTDSFWTGIMLKYSGNQDKTAVNEIPTSSHFILDYYAGTRYLLFGTIHSVVLRVENVFNTEYRDHLSVLKEYYPSPARNIMLDYSIHL